MAERPSPSRRHHHLLLAAVLALLVLGGAGWGLHERSRGTAPGEAAVAGEPGCGPVLREPVAGRSRHVDGGEITYDAAPPAFGDHRSRWEVGAAHFYDRDDRPPVSVLVHNLEHGYNILWYDETVGGDELAAVRDIAERYASLGGEPDPATAFIAAPWTSEDGEAFPGGARYALTHWYLDADDPGAGRDDELGLTRYCTGITAADVRDWMSEYPLRDAPEGFPDLM